MKRWTVQCTYAAYYANTVVVEADTIEQACEQAIAQANDDPCWKSLDDCGATFVDAIAEGDADPWTDFRSSLPVPSAYCEHGTPPLVTVTVSGGVVQQVAIEGGKVRVHVCDYDTDGADPNDPELETDETGARFALADWSNDLPPDGPAEAALDEARESTPTPE
ncbi:MAG: hypothetical protein KGJ79_18145 [Alphaproteobacteria bacterium]|nr:hypothetical protein [Alphaproteobacteria bacterium]MBU6472049.1 hypothetical protein [Alphaproteobacteria bacterium]MDE2113062.1 hypothetical protein [Alphaproteobacteria bacterium]MDE2494699.1 hypothetical protein [Alphaproteobacteria bacterium]